MNETIIGMSIVAAAIAVIGLLMTRYSRYRVPLPGKALTEELRETGWDVPLGLVLLVALVIVLLVALSWGYVTVRQ